jgi:hypothetical protein
MTQIHYHKFSPNLNSMKKSQVLMPGIFLRASTKSELIAQTGAFFFHNTGLKFLE